MQHGKRIEVINQQKVSVLLKALDEEYEVMIKGYISSLIEADVNLTQILQGKIRGIQEAQSAIRGYIKLQEALNG